MTQSKGESSEVFRREVLERAFKRIPKELIPAVLHYDHDIIYYEAYQVSQRVGILRDAVFHIEPDFRKTVEDKHQIWSIIKSGKEDTLLAVVFEEEGSGFWFSVFNKVSLQAFLLSL